MRSCDRCHDRSPLCPACIEQRVSWLGGVPVARGMAWGQGVAATMGRDRTKWKPWPAFEGKARAIAYRKVNEVQRELIDRFARACFDAARDVYERARNGATPTIGQPSFFVGRRKR